MNPVMDILNRFSSMALPDFEVPDIYTPGRIRCPFCHRAHVLKRGEVFATIKGLIISLPKDKPRGRPHKGEEATFHITEIDLDEDRRSVSVRIVGRVK